MTAVNTTGLQAYVRLLKIPFIIRQQNGYFSYEYTLNRYFFYYLSSYLNGISRNGIFLEIGVCINDLCDNM